MRGHIDFRPSLFPFSFSYKRRAYRPRLPPLALRRLQGPEKADRCCPGYLYDDYRSWISSLIARPSQRESPSRIPPLPLDGCFPLSNYPPLVSTALSAPDFVWRRCAFSCFSYFLKLFWASPDSRFLYEWFFSVPCVR